MKRTANTTPVAPTTNTTTTITFGDSAVTFAGCSEAARFSVDANRHIWVYTQMASVPTRMHIAPDHPQYAAALKAAKAAKAAPLTDDPLAPKGQPEAPKAATISPKGKAKAEAPAAEQQPKATKAAKQPSAKPEALAAKQPADKAKAKAALAEGKAERKATKAAKQPEAKAAPAAKQPVDMSKLTGTRITGKGWAIVFDDAAQRTRIIFDGQPTAGQKAAVESAGFYWSAAMGSWNKKLSVKAARAAMALADTLKALK